MNNKKVFFTYYKNEAGEIKLSRVCMYDPNTNKATQEKFDMEKHGDIFREFVSKNNMQGDTLVSELEENGLFDETMLTSEKLQNYISKEDAFTIETEKQDTEDHAESDEQTTEEVKDEDLDNELDNETTEFDSEDEYVEDDSKENKTGKRVLAGILAAGAVVGALSLLHSCENEQIVDETQNQTLEDLLNQMSEEQRAFFESSFKAVETFNNNAVKDGNFALDKDNSTLHMTVDEGIALNIIMNNYSSDDLYDIFGTVGYDATNIMNLARSAYGKLSTYYMNAKEASGLSQLINDEASREFFEKHENAVIEFNNNPSVELADEVIKGMYSDYTYNGANGEYAKINNDGVAWFATTPVFGYELANRNVPEFLKTTDGLLLNQVTTNELLTGINEEVDVDIMDELDNKSLCAAVTAQTKDKISALTMKQNIASTIIETNAKDELVEGLRESGNISLANKVLSSDMTPELLKEVSQVNSKANELVDEYNSRVSSLKEKEAKIVAVTRLAQEKYNSKEEIDIADLVNNRFRSPLVVEKVPVVDTTPGVTTEEEKKEQLREDLYVGEDEKGTPVYDGDKLNELPQEEKEEFIKDNGVIVNQETTVIEEEKVEFEELTPVEQEKVVDMEAVLREIETLKNDLIVKGVDDAIDYTETVGAYRYNGRIVIPFNGQELDTSDMTLFNIAAYDAAFGTSGIDDNQIQSRINRDAEKVVNELNSLSNDAKEYLEEKYGSNWREDFIEESYKYGYTEQIKGSLAEAVKLGAQIRQTAEEEYNKAQEALNNQNQFNNNDVVEPDIDVPGSYVPDNNDWTSDNNNNNNDNNNNDNNDYDPNLDPNYKMEDEQPYVPNIEIETPGVYVDETENSNANDFNFEEKYSAPAANPYVPNFSFETPGYYIDDAVLDDAFSKVIGEGNNGKTK